MIRWKNDDVYDLMDYVYGGKKTEDTAFKQN